MVSSLSEGYSAVARGFDRKRIICKESALAFFRAYHNSLGPIPVKFRTRSCQGLKGRGEDLGEVWGESHKERSRASAPGVDGEDVVVRGVHILPLDQISAGSWSSFDSVL